ncbi:MAG: 5-bromo-4-chloroindolyl phosphate hydrolysis family protein [Clostridiales bacterium]|nr:5-bromo-4-chloroindolyl phosphate hydrolysis family protein [Clostridiales bacterium]
MSEFDKLREILTSWPAIIIGFVFGGWPGFLLLLWKILHESSSTKNKSDSWKRSVFGSESVEQDMYWDRETQRWVRYEKGSQAESIRYDDPNATYSYTYKNGQPTSTARPSGSWGNNFVNAEGTVDETRTNTEKGRKSRFNNRTAKSKTAQSASPFPKIKDGKNFTIAGSIMTALFGFSSIINFVDDLYYIGLGYAVSDCLPIIMLTALGAGMLLWGRSKSKQAKQFRKLLNLVGNADVVSVRALSDAMGCSYDKVCDMLQTMIDAGYLGYRAYLNVATGELVMDGRPISTQPKQDLTKKAEEQELTVEEDKSLLGQIRAVNDAIRDPEMSRKIDRIEEITGHILAYQEKHPAKAAELRKFLSYYLPTTLKVLNTYAELERQQIQGENITATKKRIEGMMDKVVEGFELQLDKLFENDMLDITSDISVLENMLSQDGLSNADQMPKAPPAPEQAAAPGPGYTTADGIRLTLDPQSTGSGSAVQAPQKR